MIMEQNNCRVASSCNYFSRRPFKLTAVDVAGCRSKDKRRRDMVSSKMARDWGTSRLNKGKEPGLDIVATTTGKNEKRKTPCRTNKKERKTAVDGCWTNNQERE
jgi:hypothetical protein